MFFLVPSSCTCLRTMWPRFGSQLSLFGLSLLVLYPNMSNMWWAKPLCIGIIIGIILISLRTLFSLFGWGSVCILHQGDTLWHVNSVSVILLWRCVGQPTLYSACIWEFSQDTTVSFSHQKPIPVKHFRLLTSINPALAVANWVITHSRILGPHIPTRSPVFKPIARNPAARSITYSQNEKM